MLKVPAYKEPVIGPDLTLVHCIATFKLPGGVFETMIWSSGTSIPIDEYRNEDWEDAILAHAVAYQRCSRNEALRRKHGK